MGEAVAETFFYTTNGFPKIYNIESKADSWYEETLDDNLKWSFSLNSVLHKGTSEYQEMALLDTKHFGKVLVIDGKMQSAETDEFIYHENLIHPPLLSHSNPKSVFIMGGGEGSAAREALKHKSIEKVVMCDIDQLKTKTQFRCVLQVTVIMNAGSGRFLPQISDRDLADPVEGGPCYQLYTKSFYESILKPKLTEKGIFVTQAGPAGIFTHKEVFSSIYNTAKQVFKYVVAYTAHIPSFADTWGWVMASDHPFTIKADEIDNRIEERIAGELLYLSGASFLSSTIMNKTVSFSLLNETHVYTEENARFIHGHGLNYSN
ncbi:hypothetical protein ACFE04_018898 [Oxalis oulophora]